jgi:hypothetical protein
MNPKYRRAYAGRSGQMAVMAELLDLGCNVAIPEVDVGRDLFAFQDDEEGVTHIQVKTAGKAKALAEEGSYSAQIDVPLEQLKTTGPALYYVLSGCTASGRPSSSSSVAALTSSRREGHRHRVRGPTD